MREAAYRDYQREAGNWVKRGRGQLLHQLLHAHATLGAAGQILELGAGVGGNVSLLARHGAVDVIEGHPLGVEALRRVAGIRRLYEDEIPCPLESRYDLIVALEVLEHIADDRAALAWCRDHLVPGGVLIATVPAHPWLLTDHDRAVGHLRRYTRQQLLQALPRELPMVEVGPFVTVLFPAVVAARWAWQLGRRLLGGRSDHKHQAPRWRMVDAALGAVLGAELSWLERGGRLPIGYSWYLVARRQA